MSLTSICAAIQAKNAALTGMGSAPTAMPASFNTATLPIALCIPGDASYEAAAVGLPAVSRTFFIRCYVAPLVQGVGIDGGFQTALALLETMQNAYRVGDDLSGAVEQVLNITDTGITGGMRWTDGGTQYWGFEMRVRVKVK